MPLCSKLLAPLCLFLSLVGFGAALRADAETFRNPQRISLAVDPYGVTTGDLNGDGRNDIVWIEHTQNPQGSALHVLLAGANGRFTPGVDLSPPSDATVLNCIIEDVTGDKQNDLICYVLADFVNPVLLTYRGNGDGTFASPIKTTLDAQAYHEARVARSGDLNSDGLADVLVLPMSTSGVFPLLSDGHGSFRPAPVAQGSFNFSAPTITDLNGDGKLDVLWPTGPRVNLGNGDGTFISPPAQYDPGYLSNCAFGDVDHDGHLDAACTWFDTSGSSNIHLGVFHGNPDGSFSKAALFQRTFGNSQTEYDGAATILTPVLVADLNGDGYSDIVSLSGDGYCVLLGGANATWNGQPQEFAAASLQSQSDASGVTQQSFADMNGDGLPDIVAVGPNGLYISYAQHDGSLNSAPATEVGQVSTSATLADFNGDGNLDVVSAGDTALKLSLGNGDGTFAAPKAISTSGNFADANYVAPQVISGDFNGDGKQDLLATGSIAAYTSQTYILFGHGDGTFDAPKPTTVTLGKVADLNGDGRGDTYAIQNNATGVNALNVSISRGDGTFVTFSTKLPVETSNSSVVPASGPAFADFRHSGRLDAAIATTNNVYALRGHGDGTFDSAGTPLPIPGLPNLSNLGSFDVAAGDFDKDGNPDIAVLVQYGSGVYNFSTPTSAVWVYYGNGDGTFSSAVLAGTFNRHAQTLTAGDLNGDGSTDLVLTSYDANEYNGVLVIHSLPRRTWGPEFIYTGGEGLNPLWIVDLNHDGRMDLVFSNAHRANWVANSVTVLLNEPEDTVSGSLTASPEPSSVTYPFTLTAALSSPTPSYTFSGAVTFSLDGNVVGTSPLSGNTATLALSGTGLAAGIHTLAATWPGDTTLPPLTLHASHTVAQLPIDISLAATPTSLTVGNPLTATATLIPRQTPNQGGYQFTGTLTLFDNGLPIAHQQVSGAGFSFNLPSLTQGSHALYVAYSGDAFFSAAQSNSVSLSVAGLPSIATLTLASTSATFGTPLTGSATISSATATSFPAPTGTVMFLVDGNAISQESLRSAAAAEVFGGLPRGTHTISCSYSGDSTFAASTCNSVNVSIQPGTSELTITSSQNPSIAYAPVTFTIQLTLSGKRAPTGTQFIFSLANNSSNVLLKTNSIGVATFTTNQLYARAWPIEAIFSDPNYITNVTHFTQVVTPAPATLTLTATPNPGYIGQTVTFTAAASESGNVLPSGKITFLDGGAVLGTGFLDDTGHATLSTSNLSIGTHTITATYAGDLGFTSATSLPLNEVVLNSSFTIALSPASITVRQGTVGSTAVQLASIGNFAGPLAVGYGRLPTYGTASIDGANPTLAKGGTHSSTFTFNTVYFPPTVADAGRSSKGKAAIYTALLLILAPLSSRHRRRLGRVLGVVLLLISLQVITGCGFIGQAANLVAPGTYRVPVTATDTQGNVQTTTLTVTVTPM